MDRRAAFEIGGVVLAAAVFAGGLLRHLEYPLLWQDEAETAMFARRIAEYGFPKVHGRRNVVYEFGPNVALGIDEATDAYIGKTWGDFYFAVPGLLWARGAGDDLYDRTWRLRLPFAVAGALGVGVFASAAAPAFGHRRRRAAALFLLACATSVSLVLHLREVRYYPLLVLVTAGLAWVHLRYAVFERLPYRAWAVALPVLLFLLFHVFYTAYFVAAALIGLERALAATRGERPGERARWARLARELAPIAASGIAVAPFLVFFETFDVARSFAAHVGTSPALFATNLAFVGAHFLRQELLVPALVARGAVLAAGALARRRAVALPGAHARAAAVRLWLFALGYTVLGCANPLVYERYFVVLGPVVTLAFLLDAHTCFSAARLLGPGRAARARALLAAALGAAVLASLGARLPELRGRLAELRTPVLGPLDFAIPGVRAAYARPGELVIATNYEAHPFMYYLDSHVIVGLAGNNIVAERRLEPDVVVPRRRWPSGLPEISRFLARGSWREERYPVADLYWNNIPAVSRSPRVPDPHRFRTARTTDPSQMLQVFYRRDDGPPAEPRAGRPSGADRSRRRRRIVPGHPGARARVRAP